LKESANENLLREVLSRGFQSRSLAVIYAVNLYATGYLFPTEVILPGVDSHSWDLMVGLGGAISLLLARWYFRFRAASLYTWGQIASSFGLVFCAATATGVAGSVLLFGANIPQSSIKGVFVFGPLGTLGQISIFSLTIGAFIYSSQTSRSLAQERIALNLIQEKLREELESDKAALTFQISNAIKPSLKSIEEQVAVGARSPELVSQINDAINGVIRPLSHTLDQQSVINNIDQIDQAKLARRIRRTPLRNRFTRVAPITLAFNPVVSFAAYFGFVLVSLLYLFSWSEAIKVFLPFLIISYLFFRLLDKALGFIQVKVYIIIFVSVIFSAAQSVQFFLIGSLQGVDLELIATIAFSVLTLTLGSSTFQLIVSGIKHNLRHAEQINIEIANSFSSVRKQLWRFRKNLSRGLHGGLQAKLQILALQIEKGLEVSTASLTDVQNSLYSVVESEQEVPVPITEFLIEQKEFWDGVCEINFEVSQAVIEEADSHAVVNECIREVIRESINNAIKHAKSSRMSIELKFSRDSTVELFVLNSSNQPITSTSGSSLGSRLFEELTDSWGIEYKLDSTEFHASFKVKQSV
jgi:signal transduction histidine kinase